MPETTPPPSPPPSSPPSQPDPEAARPDGRKANAAATRAALIVQAQRFFGEQGFERTSLSQICEAAGATTGALYHHFGDKKGLFAAVAEALDAQLVAAANRATASALQAGASAWEAFLAAIDTLLQAGTSAHGRRIGLIDASAVLGADGWLAIRERHGLGAMVRAVQMLQDSGAMTPGDPVRQARIILGMLYGAMEALPMDAQALPQAMAETRALVHLMLGAMRR